MEQSGENGIEQLAAEVSRRSEGGKAGAGFRRQRCIHGYPEKAVFP